MTNINETQYDGNLIVGHNTLDDQIVQDLSSQVSALQLEELDDDTGTVNHSEEIGALGTIIDAIRANHES